MQSTTLNKTLFRTPNICALGRQAYNSTNVYKIWKIVTLLNTTDHELLKVLTVKRKLNIYFQSPVGKAC